MRDKHTGGRKPLGQLIILCLLMAFAGLGAVPSGAFDQTDTGTKTSLWSVQAGGGSVYLLGSVHFLRQGDYPLPPAMEAAYADCTRVVFETDIGAMASADVQAEMLESGFYKEGDHIFRHLSPRTSRMLKDKLAELGIPEPVVSPLKPWTAAMTLEVLALKMLGFDETAGVDFHFYKRSLNDGKRLGFLETVDYQLELLSGLNAQDQDALLRQTLEELDRVEEIAPRMVAAWRSGEYRSLNRLLPMPATLRERLLASRNRNWVEDISAFIEQPENTLVIVGALHLAGPDSVLELLRRAGYAVQQH